MLKLGSVHDFIAILASNLELFDNRPASGSRMRFNEYMVVSSLNFVPTSVLLLLVWNKIFKSNNCVFRDIFNLVG